MPHASEFRVRYAETDQMGVVYHANYLVWCEIGRTDLIRSLGGSYAELERSGVALAVVETHLRFTQPARYDEVIRVSTRVSDVRTRVVRFDYEITTAERGLLAEAYTVLVGMTRDGRSTIIPPELRESLERVRAA